MELATGVTFGPYRIDGTLGKGGMAVVYRAWESNLQRQVALKVLPPELLHQKTFAERFHREARIAAKLEHPHIVPIHAFGIEGNRPWMALRLLGGGSLADLVQMGRLEPARAIAILRDVADALDYAHQQKVIHRDVKPQNILLDEGGRAYLADFGIGKMLESSSHITATGMIQGTPSYMAPEQAEGKELGPACDVYALGIVAYQCLSGRVPFSGTPVSVLVKQVSTPPPLPSPDEVAPPLTGALHRCLAKEPTDRWPSADTFVGALETGLKAEAATPTMTDLELVVVDDSPPAPVVPVAPERPGPSPRRSMGLGVAVAAAAALVLVGLGAWWLTRGASPEPTPVASAEVAATKEPPPAVRAPEASPTTAALPPAVAERRATPRPTPAPATPEPAPARATPETPLQRAPATPPVASVAEPTPTPAVTAEPPSEQPSRAVAHDGRLRIYCAARLEPRLFKKSQKKDVEDSARDMREAFDDHDDLGLAASPSAADATILVLERGYKKTLGIPGARQVRVRVSAGGQSIELVGRDKALGLNTWKGAAKGALREAREWIEATLEAAPRP